MFVSVKVYVPKTNKQHIFVKRFKKPYERVVRHNLEGKIASLVKQMHILDSRNIRNKFYQ